MGFQYVSSLRCGDAATSFRYKKSLGQNFIYDTKFLRSVVRDLDINKKDFICEIGTGAGTLTKVLVETSAEIFTCEIDRRLQPILEKEFADIKNVTLKFADVMKLDFSSVGEFRLIANVPYYITTPIIMKFIGIHNCKDINILVASDISKRIAAKPNSKDYGALSVTCQCFADCKIIKFVGREMFTPAPKIDSAFVRICKKDIGIVNVDLLNKIIKGVFETRRKTMQNCFKRMGLPVGVLTDCGISLTARPEELPPSKYIEIAEKITNYNK
jgi:16S rRNA (adenine1518-N6/adenine1519-N6)-dimethyltransferase